MGGGETKLGAKLKSTCNCARAHELPNEPEKDFGVRTGSGHSGPRTQQDAKRGRQLLLFGFRGGAPSCDLRKRPQGNKREKRKNRKSSMYPKKRASGRQPWYCVIENKYSVRTRKSDVEDRYVIFFFFPGPFLSPRSFNCQVVRGPLESGLLPWRASRRIVALRPSGCF